ncbi:MAG: tetratricopeptide repeat protein [Rikenellaceae bacterium]
MKRGELIPTLEQTFEIRAGERGDCNFKKLLHDGAHLQSEGKIEQACNLRFGAVQRLQELIDDEAEVMLEWSDENSRAALQIIYLSAIDHFLINDFEISSALLELDLELDPEDHLECYNLLSYNYLAMGEYELFDEIINDVSDKYASRTLLLLWSGFLRDGELSSGELHSFRGRFGTYYNEFVAEEHPADEKYLKDIESERPSVAAQARELWLQTETLWRIFPQFIEALKASQK